MFSAPPGRVTACASLTACGIEEYTIRAKYRPPGPDRIAYALPLWDGN